MYITYSEPTSGVVHLATVNTEVCTYCNHMFRTGIRRCKACSTVDSCSADRSWATASLEPVFHFLDSTIQGRTFDYHRLSNHAYTVLVLGICVRIVVEGRVGNHSETEWFSILSK